MRSFGHWTPRYLYDRARVMFYRRTNTDAPWMNPTMINVLDEWLRPQDVGLEWGSGRSTCWLAKRVKHLTSVEQNQNWADWVTSELKKQGLESKVEYKIIPDSVERYIAVAESIIDATLDFCLIDGTARDRCALISLRKIKSGGIIIVDDSERYCPRRNKSRSPNARGPEDGWPSLLWREFFGAVANWRCVWTTSGVTDAAFWVKPAK